MNTLFETAKIASVMLRNRFVRSATWEGMGTPVGGITPRLVDTITALAKGGVGLIITSHAYVSAEGQAMRGQIGIHRDQLIPGLKQIAAAAHDHGAKIFLQLAHAGYFAAHTLTGIQPLAVSTSVKVDELPRKEMDAEDIRKVIQAFAAAAGRAKEAGFDGVQIHSAHGYLLNQFLSPLFNKRTDVYGGTLQNRSRVHLETLQAVKQAVGADYPVIIKVNGRDLADGGLEVQESAEAAALMETAGVHAVELSSGMIKLAQFIPARKNVTSQKKEAYNQEEARVFKQRLRVPLILVGGIRSLPLAERIFREGVCDFISMSRPFICEPDLINRWLSGDRRKAACNSDNLCYGPAHAGEGLYCVTAAKKNNKTKRGKVQEKNSIDVR
jgi:2,4-dienoyl-CoA reductase-like NADH-dependent reductase (Old Yellow Enzyme family)